MANAVQIVISAADRTRGFRDLFKNFTDLEKKSKSLGIALSYVGVVAAGALTTSLLAAAGAAAKYTLEAIKSADETGIMAERAGMAVDEFSKLSFSAQMAEVSQEDLVAASRKLSQEMVRTGRGGESVGEEMMRLADRFAAAESGASKNTLATELFGKSLGTKLLPWLNKGSAAIREETEEAKQFGLEIGPGFARQADQFGDNLDRMKGAMRGLWLQVAQDVLPTLVELTEKTLLWVKAGNNLEAAAHKIGFAFNFVLRAASELGTIEGIMDMLRAPSVTTADIISKAWKQAVADMATAKEKMRELAGEASGGAGEIINPHDADKAIALLTKIKLARMNGAEEVREKEREHFYAQLDEIAKLQISEQHALELTEQAYLNYQLRKDEIHRQHEEARAQLEQFYRDGNLTGYVNYINSRQSLDLQWLEAQRNIADTYRELWETSLLNVQAATVRFVNSALLRFSDGFSQAIADAVTGVRDWDEALEQLGKQMLGMLVKWASQMVINSVLATVLQASVATAAKAAMAPILAMNTAAATAAAIATLGAATTAGATVVPMMAANSALATGMFAGMGGMAHGGMDFVPSESTFLLQRGERVVQPEQNTRLTAFLDEWESGGGGRQPLQINLHLDGQRIADWIYDGTRDGRVQVHPRGVQDTRN